MKPKTNTEPPPGDPLLDAAIDAAEELKRLRDRLSSDTRHSFRTPLTVIDGTARRLERQADNVTPEVLRERLNTIRSTVEKMVGIVERSIELSELASCVRDNPPVTSTLTDMVDRIVEEYRDGTSGVSILSWTENCQGLNIGDRRMMELVLDKLFTLGVELVRDNGRLDFVTWTDGEFVNFSLKAVFEMRAPIDVKEVSMVLAEEKKERVTMLCKGMELKIIRLLIEQHGGELELDIDTDRVEFDIHLPVIPADRRDNCTLIYSDIAQSNG